MPEISESELRSFVRYQSLGSPEEITSKIKGLEKDNHDQRESIRALKEKQVPDGQVVVSKADADRLKQYMEMGKPDEIKGKLEKGEEAGQRLIRLERSAAASKFVAAVGLAAEAADTLAALPSLTGAEFEVRTEKVKNDQGQEVDANVGYIVLTDAKGTKEALKMDAASVRFPELKGLRMASKDEKSGVGFVPQGSDKGGPPPDGSVYDRIRNQRKAEADAAKAKREATTVDRSLESRLGMTKAS